LVNAIDHENVKKWTKSFQALMPLSVQNKTSPQHCVNCANVMNSDSSSTSLRCGYAYFAQPPLERKQMRMDHYPETQPDMHCQNWAERTINQ
jgi:hypothetical protein